MSDGIETPTGWTARGLVAVGVAVLTSAFVFFFLFEDRSAAAGADGLVVFVTGTLLGHAAGGVAAGWLLAGLFGRRGIVGWALVMLGGVLATLLGGLLGGIVNGLPALLSGSTLVTEAVRIGSAALVTPLAIASWPPLGAIWLAAIAALHVLVTRARA